MHYISVSTELWFGVGDFHTNRRSFLSWVKADLEAANKNRDAGELCIVSIECWQYPGL